MEHDQVREPPDCLRRTPAHACAIRSSSPRTTSSLLRVASSTNLPPAPPRSPARRGAGRFVDPALAPSAWCSRRTASPCPSAPPASPSTAVCCSGWLGAEGEFPLRASALGAHRQHLFNHVPRSLPVGIANSFPRRALSRVPLPTRVSPFIQTRPVFTINRNGVHHRPESEFIVNWNTQGSLAVSQCRALVVG